MVCESLHMSFKPQLIRKAGLNPTDVHRLLGVSRQTTTKWFSGGGVHYHLTEKVTRFTRAVARALEAGRLPIQDTRRADVRAANLAAVIRNFEE